jgi:hypothetical protein
MSSYEAPVPRTDEEVATLLTVKPPGWEYLLYAGSLLLGVQRLEQRHSDYMIGYAPRTGTVIMPADFAGYIQSQICELQVIIGMLNVLIGNETFLRDAIGPPGEAGDPDKIAHAASRIINLYEDFLLWAERIRGHAMPSAERKVADALAKFAEQPIEELRDFVRRLVRRIDNLPAEISSDQSTPIIIQETITLTIPSAVSEEFSTRLDDLKRENA